MYKDILFPIDLNHDSSWVGVLPSVVEYCKAFSARLHVVTVVPDFSMPLVGSYFPANFGNKMVDDANKHLHEFIKKHVPSEVHVQHIVAEGVVYKEIIRIANEIGADLIIMASHRPELGDFLVGPNAERVVRHFNKSVLVVRN
ncbi:MAG TPA: universal stress protein [Candidatus Competibacteraceae bacterium]|nr:universal stress protein [Candidatus Competibacteraceae bacterium]MCP5134321.1 universal stress protein [Gammaproteobacteria bacterium]HPF58193.1 universal stress protein [Candidatus Competibacteraceae bacterium]HRY17141.1 universal stress protein [Candidatus Competibacteraceae bacterium]